MEIVSSQGRFRGKVSPLQGEMTISDRGRIQVVALRSRRKAGVDVGINRTILILTSLTAVLALLTPLHRRKD